MKSVKGPFFLLKNFNDPFLVQWHLAYANVVLNHLKEQQDKTHILKNKQSHIPRHHVFLLHKLSLKWTHIPCLWHSIAYARFLITGNFQAVVPSCVASFLCMAWIREVRLCGGASASTLCTLLNLGFSPSGLVSDTEQTNSGFVFLFLFYFFFFSSFLCLYLTHLIILEMHYFHRKIFYRKCHSSCKRS